MMKIMIRVINGVVTIVIKTKSLKSCKMIKSPSMLIISLKRFKTIQYKVGNRMDYKFTKNNSHVKIHNDLDINNFSISNESPFTLNAIANHMGGTDGGHYNAFCKYDDSWFLIDDETIRKTTTYNDCSAYTLFYSKIPHFSK